MSQNGGKPTNESFNEAVLDLQRAINATPLEELADTIKEDLGGKWSIDTLPIRRALEDLEDLANLADPTALSELASIESRIRIFLNKIKAKNPSTNPESSSAKKAPRLGSPKFQDQIALINQAASRLLDVLKGGTDKQEQELSKAIQILGGSAFSFPLEIQENSNGPPDKHSRLILDFCDRLIKNRFETKSRDVLEAVAKPKPYDSTMPAGWGAAPKNVDGPLSLVRPIFEDLENQRTISRSREERTKLEKRENDLLDYREALVEFAHEGSADPNRVNDSEQPAKSISPFPREVRLQTLWAERAALLPPLDTHTSSIGKWVDAGFLWVIAQHDARLTELEWNESIQSRIAQTGSLNSGIRLFLREGFETLAGRDQGQMS
ncbi:hypothetical protein N9Z02_00820 [Akkermansiaceae bacterium]|nr:hypothetical protein [Akkermansiaceae bacterium]